VAVILEAHALNVNAQNALLKTVEEPPPRSLLLLVTHAPGSLLATVRSRCQRVRCAPLPDELVIDILEHQCQLGAEEAAVAGACAEGSPGRALQLRAALGAAREGLLGQLAHLSHAGYVRIAQMTGHPTLRNQPELALALMLTWFRDQAVRAAGAESIGLYNADLGARLTTARLANAVHDAELVTEALAQLRRGNPNRQLLLESLFLRLRHH
jgi:DNA polymerase-3 subunit delta'